MTILGGLPSKDDVSGLGDSSLPIDTYPGTEFIELGNTIQTAGTITKVYAFLRPRAGSGWRLKIWRLNGSNYDFVGMSERFGFPYDGFQQQTLTNTIDVQVGDLIGVHVWGSSGDGVADVDNNPGGSVVSRDGEELFANTATSEFTTHADVTLKVAVEELSPGSDDGVFTEVGMGNDITLSNNGNTVENTSGGTWPDSNAYGDRVISTGDVVRFEVTVDVITDDFMIGFAKESYITDYQINYASNITGGVQLYFATPSDVRLWHGGAIVRSVTSPVVAQDDVIGVELNFNANEFKYYHNDILIDTFDLDTELNFAQDFGDGVRLALSSYTNGAKFTAMDVSALGIGSECVDYGITAGDWILGNRVYFEDDIFGYLVAAGGVSNDQRNAYYDKPIVSTEKRYMEAYWHTVNVSGNFIFGLSNNTTEQVDRYFETQNTVAFQIAEGVATSVLINGTNVSTLTDPATNYQDVIALGVDYSAQTVEFFKNDVSYGVIDISSIISGPLYFAVTMNPIAKVYFRDTLIKQQYTNDAAYIPIGGRGSYEQDTFGNIGANLTRVGNTVSQQSGGFGNSTAYISNPIHVGKKKYFEVESVIFDEHTIGFITDPSYTGNPASSPYGRGYAPNSPSTTVLQWLNGTIENWGPDLNNANGDIIGVGYTHENHVVRIWKNGVEQDTKVLSALGGSGFSAGGLPVWVGIGHRGSIETNVRTRSDEFTYPIPEGFTAIGEYDCIITEPLGINSQFPLFGCDIAAAFTSEPLGIDSQFPLFGCDIVADNSPPDVYINTQFPLFRCDMVAETTGDSTILRFSDLSFTTTPISTPPDQYVEGRLINPGNLSRDINTEDFEISRPGFGIIKVSNIDGALDYLKDYGVSGQPVTIYFGKNEWDESVFILEFKVIP